MFSYLKSGCKYQSFNDFCDAQDDAIICANRLLGFWYVCTQTFALVVFNLHFVTWKNQIKDDHRILRENYFILLIRHKSVYYSSSCIRFEWQNEVLCYCCSSLDSCQSWHSARQVRKCQTRIHEDSGMAKDSIRLEEIESKGAYHEVWAEIWSDSKKYLIYWYTETQFEIFFFQNSESCGIPNTQSDKIVGGVEATPHEFPWQVGLFFDGYFCGGTIICTLSVSSRFTDY